MESFDNLHVFDTEQQAQNAIDLINETLGIPVSDDSTTITYIEYLEQDGKFVFDKDETTIQILK